MELVFQILLSRGRAWSCASRRGCPRRRRRDRQPRGPHQGVPTAARQSAARRLPGRPAPARSAGLRGDRLWHPPPTTHKLRNSSNTATVKKSIGSCVEGRPTRRTGTWQDHLRKVYGKPQAEMVPAEHPEAKLAVLTIGLPATEATLAGDRIGDRPTRIKSAFKPPSRGYPVLGDFQYGANTPFGPPQDDERLRAIALHAGRWRSFIRRASI